MMIPTNASHDSQSYYFGQPDFGNCASYFQQQYMGYQPLEQPVTWNTQDTDDVFNDVYS
jgi:hypothetical protein